MRLPASFLLAALLVGCAGSTGSNETPVVKAGTPTGGGGKVADYVGSYVGTFETVSTDGTTPTTVGTVALTIASDGTVAGTRRASASGADVPLAGTIDAQGRLSLMRPGTNVHGQANLLGYLAKQRGTAVVTLVEDQDGSEVQTWYAYRLTGGSTTAGAAPLTSGLWFGGQQKNRLAFTGFWYAADRSVKGEIDLSVAPTGTVTGTWKGTDGTSQKATGVVYDLDGFSYLQGSSGTLTVGGQTLDLRLVPWSSGPTFLSYGDFVGTASTPDGRVSNTLVLSLKD